MLLNLSTSRLMFDEGPHRLVELAVAHDFDTVDAQTSTFEDDTMREEFVAHVADAGLGWGLASIPVPVGTMTADRDFDAALPRFDALAAHLSAAGATTLFHWIAPANDELPFDDAMRLHVGRLNRVAPILAEHGLRLALEYVGQRSWRTTKKYDFVFDLAGMVSLIDGLDDPARFGLVLDTIHWHGAGDTVEGLTGLSADDILAVDLNDAPLGTDLDTLQDLDRRMPGATGVIATSDFVGALRTVGYQGRVNAEVFGEGLQALEHEERVRVARAALDRVLAAAPGRESDR